MVGPAPATTTVRRPRRSQTTKAPGARVGKKIRESLAFVTCGVCDRQLPKSAANEHHKDPQAFGGEVTARENLIWLCPTCHHLLHRCAENIARGTAGVGYELLNATFPTQPKFRERAWTLAQQAAKAEVLFREGEIELPVVSVSTKVDRDVWGAFCAKAVDAGMKPSRLLAKVIEQYAQKP